MRKHSSWVLRIFIPIISILFSLAISELLLYHFSTKPDPLKVSIVPAFDSPFLYTRQPSQVARVAGKLNHVNNFGFRRMQDTREERSADKVRVLSYGDSIGQGFKVEDGEQYTDQLESMLNRSQNHADWEVLSTFRGSSPGIYSFHIQIDQPRFRPDWIFLEIELQNDLTDEALLSLSSRDKRGLPTEVYGARYVVGVEGDVINNLSSTIPFISRTLVYSKITWTYGEIMSRLTRNPLFSRDAFPYYYHIGPDRYLLTQDKLEKAFDSMFQTIVAIQNFVESNSRFVLILIAGRDAFGTTAKAKATRSLFQRAVMKSKELGIPYVDTYPYLEEAGGQELFTDFCHPNKEGHKAIALALFDFIRERKNR
jgi:lysophospholipase L1-like esterase